MVRALSFVISLLVFASLADAAPAPKRAEALVRDIIAAVNANDVGAYRKHYATLDFFERRCPRMLTDSTFGRDIRRDIRSKESELPLFFQLSRESLAKLQSCRIVKVWLDAPPTSAFGKNDPQTPLCPRLKSTKAFARLTCGDKAPPVDLEFSGVMVIGDDWVFSDWVHSLTED